MRIKPKAFNEMDNETAQIVTVAVDRAPSTRRRGVHLAHAGRLGRSHENKNFKHSAGARRRAQNNTISEGLEERTGAGEGIMLNWPNWTSRIKTKFR